MLIDVQSFTQHSSKQPAAMYMQKYAKMTNRHGDVVVQPTAIVWRPRREAFAQLSVQFPKVTLAWNRWRHGWHRHQRHGRRQSYAKLPVRMISFWKHKNSPGVLNVIFHIHFIFSTSCVYVYKYIYICIWYKWAMSCISMWLTLWPAWYLLQFTTWTQHPPKKDYSNRFDELWTSCFVLLDFCVASTALEPPDLHGNVTRISEEEWHKYGSNFMPKTLMLVGFGFATQKNSLTCLKWRLFPKNTSEAF